VGVARLLTVPTSLVRAAAAIPALAVRGEPLQSALFAGPWREALARAGGGFALVDLILVRPWPFVRGALPRAPLVLDYVDALSEAARRAAVADPSWFLRAYWRLEAPRLSRLEEAAGAHAALRIATTSLDAAALPAGTRPLANGVPIGPPPGPAGERGRVVAFSGRLGYRPNHLAMERLLAGIWPRVRAEVPDAVLAVGGADAPSWLRRRDGSDGLTVTSPVADMPAFLRAARAAALPVEMGTGFPNKLFEAFEAGTPAVAPPGLLSRALGEGVDGAFAAGDDAEFAARLVELLRDEKTASAAGAAARGWVEVHASREEAVGRLAAWLRETAGGGEEAE
jgi:glycosyltransferase involved in cell wall biosynthesis